MAATKEQKRAWYLRNKERAIGDAKAWAAANPEKRKEIKAAWIEKNPNYLSEYLKEYRVKNKELKNAETSARRKRVQQNTPSWACRRQLVEFYRNCPPGYHVDHILPLKGKEVSGLHVIENLQYLPAEENLKKGNRCHT